MNIGKVLLIFFEGNEEKVIDSIISVLGVGREKFAFQQMYSNSEVNYKDIIFDFKRALNYIKKIINIHLICDSRYHIARKTNIKHFIFLYYAWLKRICKI